MAEQMNIEIEEMTRIACVGFHEGDCEHCPRRGFCSSYTVSRKLYHKGWRKASDIVAEFADMLKCHAFYMSDEYGEVIEPVITVKTIIEIAAELTKKYEKEKRS